MFPAELFEAFIDIGHYNREISAYLPLVNKLNSLSVSSHTLSLSHGRPQAGAVGCTCTPAF